MTPHHLQPILFGATSVLFFLIAAGLLYRAVRKELTSRSSDLKKLVARLDQVNKENVTLIATDLLEGRDQIAPEALYGMLGGLNGMIQLEENCKVLIELATYVQRSEPSAVVVAEELRLAAREMQWHVGRLRGAAAAGHLRSTFPDNAQQAVRVYYGMTRLVLELCERENFAGNSVLRHAL